MNWIVGSLLRPVRRLYETGVPVDLEALLERALDGNAHDMEWEAWLQSELEAKKRRQQEQEAELEAGEELGGRRRADGGVSPHVLPVACRPALCPD